MILFGLILLLLVLSESKLVMVQSVFRHGARYPIYPNKYDGTIYAVELDKIGTCLNIQASSAHQAKECIICLEN